MERLCVSVALTALVVLSAGVAGAAPRRIDVAVGDSLVAVRDRVRNLSAAEKAEGVEVVLAPGDYFLADGLELKDADGGVSASAPVVWRAEKQGTVRLLGARKVPFGRFAPVRDPALLARLPEEGRGKVCAADISDLLPGKVPEIGKSFGGAPGAPMVFIGGDFGQLARWPNEGWSSFSNRVDKGQQLSKEAYPGAYRNGAFVFAEPRARRWDFAKGVWFNGYWTHDWYNWSIKAATYGPENGTNDVVRLDGDMTYGVMGGTWGAKSRRVRAFNLFEELDAPGEWWLDRARKILYIVPLRGAPSAADDVALAVSPKELLRGGGVRNLRFENLSFEYAFGTIVSFWQASDVTFAGCRFANTGRNGVVLAGYRNALVDCEIVNCGAKGADVSGGDRLKLVRSDSRVENCRIHRFGVFQRTYAAGVHTGGVGVTLRGNEIFDAPHSAVLYGGNEMLFEGNDVHHVLMETGDAGAFYTGRDWTTMGNVLRGNFVHELGALGRDANTMGFYFADCDCGDAVYGNVFWKVARGIMVGGGREHPIRDNVFADCQIGLSIDCRGMVWKSWNTLYNGWDLERKAENLRYREEPWKSRYPLLAKIMQDSPREPLYNPVEGNVFIDCREQLVALGWGKEMDAVLPKLALSNNWVFVSSPTARSAAPDKRIAAAFNVCTNGADAGFVDSRNGDFRLKPGAVVAARLPALAEFLKDWKFAPAKK